VLADIFLLVFGLTGIRIFTRLVEMPKSVLIPLIILLSTVGAYAINNSVTDVWWMLGFGVLGYFMRQYGYPVGPVILGVILARLVDENWRRAIISARESFGDFMTGILTSPLSLVLFLFIVVIALGQTPLWARLRHRRQQRKAGEA